MSTVEFMQATEHKIIQQQVDILICAMPPLHVDRVPGAPAVLKGAAEELGFVAQSVDLSINFFINQCNSNIEKYEKLQKKLNKIFYVE